MFGSTVIALALLQFHSPETTRVDLDMTFAVEEFVAETGATPPTAIQVVLIDAGSAEWVVREQASRRMRWLEPRWIMWGLASPDPEVRLRSSNALKRATWCRDCQGTGQCQFAPTDPDRPDGPCRKCSNWSYSHNGNGSECCKCDSHGYMWINHDVLQRSCWAR